MTKPFHVGHAARNGLLAALLAKEGMTANAGALEHPQGFFAVYNGAGNFQRRAHPRAMGRARSTSPIRASPSSASLLRLDPSGRRRHAASARGARARRPTASPRSNPGRIRAGSRTPTGPIRRAASTASSAIQYVLARALMHGIVSLEHFSDDAVRDPATRALMARVHAAPDPDGRRARPTITSIAARARHDDGGRGVRASSSIGRSAATATIRCRPARWKRNSATARRLVLDAQAVGDAAATAASRLETLPDVSRRRSNVIAAGVQAAGASQTRSRAYA